MTRENIVSVLQELGKRCRDSEEGYRTAADDTRDAELKRQFQQLSEERAQMAEELDRLIRENGGEPSPKGGSLAGHAHRMFLDLKAALSRDDRQTVLEEVARGEGVAEAAYDKALREDLPFEARRIVQAQHDRVRSTRDRYRAMSGYGRGGGAGEMGARVQEYGRQSAEAMGYYVRERPLTASLIAFGLGLVIGALTMSASGGGHNGSRRRY